MTFLPKYALNLYTYRQERCLKWLGEIKERLTISYNVYDRHIEKLKPPGIWFLDEILLHINPKIVFANSLLQGLPYSDDVLRNAKIRCVLVMMISTQGEMLPPAIIFLKHSFTPFVIKGHEAVFITANRGALPMSKQFVKQ